MLVFTLFSRIFRDPAFLVYLISYKFASLVLAGGTLHLTIWRSWLQFVGLLQAGIKKIRRKKNVTAISIFGHRIIYWRLRQSSVRPLFSSIRCNGKLSHPSIHPSMPSIIHDILLTLSFSLVSQVWLCFRLSWYRGNDLMLSASSQCSSQWTQSDTMSILPPPIESSRLPDTAILVCILPQQYCTIPYIS